MLIYWFGVVFGIVLRWKVCGVVGLGCGVLNMMELVFFFGFCGGYFLVGVVLFWCMGDFLFECFVGCFF